MKGYINVERIEIRKGDYHFPFKCVAIFDNGDQWTIRMPILEKLCDALGKCEDKRYPNGLGRNMFLLGHLMDIYKEYLDKHNFKPNPNHLDFSKSKKIRSNIKIIDLTGDENERTDKME